MRICFALFLFILSANVFADKDSFETLRKEYSSLRNTDTQGKRLNERRELIKRLIKLDNSDLSEREGVQTLTYAAVLSGETYKFSKDITDAKLARDALQKLELDFSESSLVDDAYLALSEVLPPADKKAVSGILGEKFAKSDSALALTSSVETPQAIDSSKKVVVIDPGHGGEDLGGVGDSGVYEKDVVLDIAKRVQSLFQENANFQIVLTRTGDSFIPLEKRTAFANNANAKLFLSLHVNSLEDKKTSGLEFYVLDSTTDEAVIRLSQLENSTAEKDDSSDVSLIVSELVQKGKLEDSLRSAAIFQKSLMQTIKTVEWKTKNLGIKKGPFFVLMGAHMPALLLELGFISNESDEEALLQDEVRDALAEGIKKGIIEYLDS